MSVAVSQCSSCRGGSSPSWSIGRRLPTFKCMVIPLTCQVDDKIHADTFQRSMRWWQWHIGSVACMAWCCDSVAHLTSSNRLSYHRIYRRPLDTSQYEIRICTSATVARFGIVMAMTCHIAPERFWYVYPPSVGQGPKEDIPILL